MKIVTRYDRLPIEERSFDWTATMDSYQAGDPVGKGDTEKAAVADLLVQVDLKDYEAPNCWRRPMRLLRQRAYLEDFPCELRTTRYRQHGSGELDAS